MTLRERILELARIFAMEQNRVRVVMRDQIEQVVDSRIGERPVGDWRAVVSAWLVAFLMVVLFAAADAFASLHKPEFGKSPLAGVVLPRHDPSFPGPNEMAASDWLERVRAEAYSGF